jgi:hypothetical protein
MAALTLLDLRETWQNSTKEERKDLVHIMLKEVGVDVMSKRVLWVKPRPDYESLFSIMRDLRQDEKRYFWIEGLVTQGNNRDIEADTGQMSTDVKIALPVSHNTLTIVEEYVQ